jgi:3-oxoacyl-[acyl-carrier protein] reductase
MKDKIFKLCGENAIVTGAAGDLGCAMADALMTHGANVAILDLKEEQGIKNAEALTKEHEADGTRAIFKKVNLRDMDDVQRVVDEVIAEFGSLEILVNDAGIDHEHVPAWEIPEETLSAVFDIDLQGCYRTIKAVVPYWIKNKIEGRICNVASGNAFLPAGGLAAYSAAKAGVANMTKTVAGEAGRYGIRCNCICPGLCLTSMTERFAKGPAGQPFWKATPMYEFSDRHRVGTPEDQAKAVIMLCSNYAEWISGEVVAVDGGAQARKIHDYTDEDYKVEHGEYPKIEW